jgi:hypothetical protein
LSQPTFSGRILFGGTDAKITPNVSDNENKPGNKKNRTQHNIEPRKQQEQHKDEPYDFRKHAVNLLIHTFAFFQKKRNNTCETKRYDPTPANREQRKTGDTRI